MKLVNQINLEENKNLLKKIQINNSINNNFY